MGAGAGFIILNLVRLLSVIALIGAATISVMIITLEVPRFGHFFFQILGEGSRIATCFILIASEMPVKKTAKFFARNVQCLTHGRSLAYTGWPMLVLSVSLLSDLRTEVLKSSALGQAVYTLILVIGPWMGMVGVLYTIMPLLYWRSPAGECRRTRKDGAIGAPKDDLDFGHIQPVMNISRPQFPQFPAAVKSSDDYYAPFK